MTKISYTSIWQCGLQCRTLENLATLKVVVHILNDVHRVKQQKQRLASDRVNDLCRQCPAAQVVAEEFSVRRSIVD